ncbi:hypothetical protein D9Q98_001606 [Chlorella vulgaris]|uniref:Uncharacterized protein n=1 Tax=Chlorella vulgaris TaxID=3077 RepID=A0A9D4YZY4_CHLVU|nr:hypothetical protein D9Q98_001606 [Chlorella vulgaris]
MASTPTPIRAATRCSQRRPPASRSTLVAALQGCGKRRQELAPVAAAEPLLQRRQLLGVATTLCASLSFQRIAIAEGAVPKAYETTAHKLVDALREAISTDLSDAEEREVRRAADPAKSLVREFLTRWKGNGLVEGEESYRQLSAAIQQLGQFYQQNGQRTRLSGEVGREVLNTLDAAEAALPLRDAKTSLLPFF